MKKLIAFVLISACILCMYGCEKPNEVKPTEASITEGMLDGGADIALDANMKPEDNTTGPEIMNGILDGGADIGVDVKP